jgi:hypothetical protein
METKETHKHVEFRYHYRKLALMIIFFSIAMYFSHPT